MSPSTRGSTERSRSPSRKIRSIESRPLPPVAPVMTRFLAALALLLGTAALADCVQEGVAVWPATGSVVPTNARFVLEGVGPDQATVSALVNGELVLRTEGDA